VELIFELVIGIFCIFMFGVYAFSQWHLAKLMWKINRPAPVPPPFPCISLSDYVSEKFIKTVSSPQPSVHEVTNE
jgi:hypothetical protein